MFSKFIRRRLCFAYLHLKKRCPQSSPNFLHLLPGHIVYRLIPRLATFFLTGRILWANPAGTRVSIQSRAPGKSSAGQPEFVWLSASMGRLCLWGLPSSIHRGRPKIRASMLSPPGGPFSGQCKWVRRGRRCHHQSSQLATLMCSRVYSLEYFVTSTT